MPEQGPARVSVSTSGQTGSARQCGDDSRGGDLPDRVVPGIGHTTSQMLTTGVDVQTCKNIVLLRTVNSMSEFKQIIGRGTRVRDDYGKLFFNILDYTDRKSVV